MLTDKQIEQGASFATRFIQNPADREDAAQEYRIAAWEALRRAAPERDPAAFQRAYARGAVLNFFRSLRRQIKTVSLDSPLGHPSLDLPRTLHDTLPAPIPDPARISEDRDFSERLEFLIHQLPARQQQITRMWLAGMSTREICQILGHTRQAVNRRKSEVIRMLRRKLGVRQVA